MGTGCFLKKETLQADPVEESSAICHHHVLPHRDVTPQGTSFRVSGVGSRGISSH